MVLNSDQKSHDCWTFPLGHFDFLRLKSVFPKNIFSLKQIVDSAANLIKSTKVLNCTVNGHTTKLDIAHSVPDNFRGDRTVYITHERLTEYLDVLWGVAI